MLVAKESKRPNELEVVLIDTRGVRRCGWRLLILLHCFFISLSISFIYLSFFIHFFYHMSILLNLCVILEFKFHLFHGSFTINIRLNCLSRLFFTTYVYSEMIEYSSDVETVWEGTILLFYTSVHVPFNIECKVKFDLVENAPYDEGV